MEDNATCSSRKGYTRSFLQIDEFSGTHLTSWSRPKVASSSASIGVWWFAGITKRLHRTVVLDDTRYAMLHCKYFWLTINSLPEWAFKANRPFGCGPGPPRNTYLSRNGIDDKGRIGVWVVFFAARAAVGAGPFY